ncbi:hypothetical protein HK105_202918 [Polyrhizophydium stewartii]|uniref:Protein kinase domain-containing protein n=1 Tax=Polyrhizophydium stewartii TaxID=2732419 RepID=A0ABR4NDQ0_9FUNG
MGYGGPVKLVELKATKKKYALKYINKLQCIEKKQVYHMFDERMLLESLENPFIVNLRYAFQDDENMFMVLDVALGGDLRYHLLRIGSFPEDTLRIYAAEIGLALQYLHSLRIMHRDLKPDNLLLDENGHIYVTDFNIAYKIKEKLPSSQSGSMAYMGKFSNAAVGLPYDVFVDWWALGVVLYECTYGYRPFRESEDRTLVEAIVHSEPKFPVGPPEHVLRVQAMRKKNKKEKPLPEWVESEGRTSFLKDLLVKDVSKRIGSGPDGFETQIKKHPWFAGFDWDKAGKKAVVPSFVPDPNNANFEATHEIEEVIMNDMKTLQYKPRKKKKNGTDSRSSSKKKKKPVDPETEAIEKALDYIDLHFIPYNKELQIGRLDASALAAAPDKHQPGQSPSKSSPSASAAGPASEVAASPVEARKSVAAAGNDAEAKEAVPAAEPAADPAGSPAEAVAPAEAHAAAGTPQIITAPPAEQNTGGDGKVDSPEHEAKPQLHEPRTSGEGRDDSLPAPAPAPGCAAAQLDRLSIPSPAGGNYSVSPGSGTPDPQAVPRGSVVMPFDPTRQSVVGRLETEPATPTVDAKPVVAKS